MNQRIITGHRIKTVMILFVLQLIAAIAWSQSAKPIDIKLTKWKFRTGDNPGWASPAYNDKDWMPVQIAKYWELQGFEKYDGFAWYRTSVYLPSSLKKQAKDGLRIYLGMIDDRDTAYLNGQIIGNTASWNKERVYHVESDNKAINWNGYNVISIKVYDAGGFGGMYSGQPDIRPTSKTDFVNITYNQSDFIKKGLQYRKIITLSTSGAEPTKGIFQAVVFDPRTNKYFAAEKKKITIRPNKSSEFKYEFQLPKNGQYQVRYSFKQTAGVGEVDTSEVLPYILTPKSSSRPQINGTHVIGIRPGSPFYFYIPVTGEKPLKIDVEKLPEGLLYSPDKQLITGSLKNRGVYSVTLKAENKKGKVSRFLKIIVGENIGLTPPMGWNSWNCWGLSVNSERVKDAARALTEKGLINHGWTYINIDDGWEAPARNPEGQILSNEKFPDMKALSDYLHDRGLKFGIYSSPGPETCGKFLGSYGHEKQDAETYNSWGIDYLKYDWCSYGSVAGSDTAIYTFEKPYLLMSKVLKDQPRDIYFSFCQYGMKDVWKWGAEAGGNSWRTTGDIDDSWASLKEIGFSQSKLSQFAGPGHWNDPDMLTVGWVGWGENLHRTHLTPDEQYTHMSMWSLLSAPLLLGCDLSKLDDFTVSLLTNDAVIAVDQDPLGIPAKEVYKRENIVVYAKPLEDGSIAVGIFNLADHYQKFILPLNILNIQGKYELIDLWRQASLGKLHLPYQTGVTAHGVVLLKLKKL